MTSNTIILRYLIGYASAVFVSSAIDVAIMLQRFGANSDLTRFEALLLPLSGLRLSWPVHLSAAFVGAAWLFLIARLRITRLARSVAFALPLACTFAVALYFAVRLPFFQGTAFTSVLRYLPPLGLLAMPAAAAGMAYLSRNHGLARRALLALPILLGLLAFAAVACVTFSVAVRVPATLFVVTTLGGLIAWLLPQGLDRLSARTVAAAATSIVLGLGASSAIVNANDDRRIRSDAAVAYRTYIMQAFLFTNLAMFKPTLPQPTCPDAAARRLEPIQEATFRRNVLLLTVDAARADHFATYGYDRITMPHVEALAKDSLVFETAYSASPATQASMVALWSGIGIPTLREASMWPPTMHSLLRSQGYATFATRLLNDISASVPGLRQPDSFDRSVPMGQRAPELVANLLEFIDDSGGKPWIASAHFIEPHDSDRYSALPKVFPERPWSRYDDSLHFVDKHIGLLLDGLRERQMLDNTVVIVSADHGEFFGEHGRLYHGSLLYEPVMRVPLVVWVPGREAARVAWPVSGFDIAPTVLRAATGQPWPVRTVGNDLLGLLDDSEPDRHAVFMENVSSVNGVRRHVAVRNGQWKYLAFLGTDVEQLFDITSDPGELRNLAGKRPRVRDEMRNLLHEVLRDRACVREQLILRRGNVQTGLVTPRDVAVDDR